MTATPHVAPSEAVERIGDIHPDELANLDRIMEGEAVCCAGDGVATYLVRHAGCSRPSVYCDHHAEQLRLWLDYLASQGANATVRHEPCNTRVLTSTLELRSI